jgi:hypothetical protein
MSAAIVLAFALELLAALLATPRLAAPPKRSGASFRLGGAIPYTESRDTHTLSSPAIDGMVLPLFGAGGARVGSHRPVPRPVGSDGRPGPIPPSAISPRHSRRCGSASLRDIRPPGSTVLRLDRRESSQDDAHGGCEARCSGNGLRWACWASWGDSERFSRSDRLPGSLRGPRVEPLLDTLAQL